jgi:hypothetical protein
MLQGGNNRKETENTKIDLKNIGYEGGAQVRIRSGYGPMSYTYLTL